MLTFAPYKHITLSVKVNKRWMIIMGATEEIIKMPKENTGTDITVMLVASGFSRGNIEYFVEKGLFCTPLKIT